jgi:hypothetical protein
MEETMANGKPGDNAITDIIRYKLPVYSPTIDSLITEIVDLGGRPELEVKLIDNAKAPPDLLEAELRTLRDRYREEARNRGWEVER